jgi:hypothetical protein
MATPIFSRLTALRRAALPPASCSLALRVYEDPADLRHLDKVGGRRGGEIVGTRRIQGLVALAATVSPAGD